MMTSFRKLSIKHKLLAGPLTVASFLLILSYVAYTGLSGQKNALQEIFHLRFQAYQSAGGIIQEMSEVHANVYKVISWANAKYDPKKIRQLGQDQNAALDRNIALVKKNLALPELTGEEKKLYQAALTDLAEYRKPVTGVLDLADSDLNMATMFMGTADDKFQSLRKTLEDLLILEKSLSRKSYEASEASAEIRLKTYIGVSAAAIGLSLLISFLIARLIGAPLAKAIDNLSEGAGQVASASSQVTSASHSLAEGTSEQAAGLEETSSSMEEMSSMTKQNADHARQAKAMMGEANEIVDNVNHHMGNMAQAIAEITKSSEETGKIIKTIDEIAFQTNLLALNAAVEAARAGEAGAGFAVVADEVRNLALRASEAAKNTNNLIENTMKAVKKGNALTVQTQDAFRKNVEISSKIGKLIDEISAASQEQAQGIEQVGKALAEMDRVVQQNAANAEESASAAEEMNGQAEQMKGIVQQLSVIVGGAGIDAKRAPVCPMEKKNGARISPDQREKEKGPYLKERGMSGFANPEQVIPLEEGGFKEF
ncbi:MAG TPA: methyl-accepting chemotaxis protein [Thermodesulfobacteriota bacterium]|nr:methyl-accepting chemotaxis protein [Thermodesulfobacteriota bacterium]